MNFDNFKKLDKVTQKTFIDMYPSLPMDDQLMIRLNAKEMSLLVYNNENVITKIVNKAIRTMMVTTIPKAITRCATYTFEDVVSFELLCNKYVDGLNKSPDSLDELKELISVITTDKLTLYSICSNLAGATSDESRCVKDIYLISECMPLKVHQELVKLLCDDGLMGTPSDLSEISTLIYIYEKLIGVRPNKYTKACKLKFKDDERYTQLMDCIEIDEKLKRDPMTLIPNLKCATNIAPAPKIIDFDNESYHEHDSKIVFGTVGHNEVDSLMSKLASIDNGSIVKEKISFNLSPQDLMFIRHSDVFSDYNYIYDGIVLKSIVEYDGKRYLLYKHVDNDSMIYGININPGADDDEVELIYLHRPYGAEYKLEYSE